MLFFIKVSLPGQVLKKWYHVRKIDWRKPNVYENYKLDDKNSLFPGFPLSSFKSLKWREQIPAPYFYAVLCEATHPNALANTLYVDDSSGTNEFENVFIIRKVPITIEPYITLYDYISTPTIECVRMLDKYMSDLTALKVSLASYLVKARRVTQ